jgi:hypothetical protein
MHTATLQLSPPAFLTLQSADGGPTVKVDVYEARRALDDARRQPTEERHHAAILAYLAGKLGVGPETLAENMALEFNDCVVTLVETLNEERKKKQESIRCSLQFTPESPATTAIGR